MPGPPRGLYKTVDGGSSFARITGPEVIVNDVLIDPQDPNRVLLATDRGCVILSQYAGGSFEAAYDGFSVRKLEEMLIDRDNPPHGSTPG